MTNILCDIMKEDWCEKRNCLVLVSRTCEVFPIFEANALKLKEGIESLIHDQSEDIAMLALSLSRKMASCQDKWIDRAPKPASIKVDEEPIIESQSKVANHKSVSEKKAEVVARRTVPNDRRVEDSPPKKRAPSLDREDINLKRTRADDRDSRRDRNIRSNYRGGNDAEMVPRNRDRGGMISRR
jgi:hypothetical protein